MYGSNILVSNGSRPQPILPWRQGWLALAAFLLLALVNLTTGPAQSAAAGVSQFVGAGQTPAGLTGVEWAAIQQQIANGPYRVAAANDGYSAVNVAQDWRVAYTPAGTTRLTPRDADAGWQWGLTLRRYGYGAGRAVSRPQQLQAVDERLTNTWDENLSEWWLNGANGLEQGFTLNERPGQAAGQSLQLTMAVTGGLTPVLQGSGVAFVDQAGAVMFTYDKLIVIDAAGQIIPAHLDIGTSAADAASTMSRPCTRC